MLTARVSVRNLKEKLDRREPVLILDVRQGFCDSDRMIPGAIHVDASHLRPELFKLPHEAEIIVYDNDPQSRTALQVAQALTQAGYQAEALVGGWDNWKDAGFPTEARHEISLRDGKKALETSQETPVERTRGILAETGQEVGKMAEELRTSAAETAQEARQGAADLARRAVSLVGRLIRR